MKIFLFILAAAFVLCPTIQAQTLKFVENNLPFQNPGQGWACYHLRFRPAQNLPHGAGYYRYDWSMLEPVEGEYNWKPIDDLIDLYAKKGLPFYFRVMTANAHSTFKYSTPQWVNEKGAPAYEYKGMKYRDKFGELSDVHVSPDFNAPIMLDTHERFIKALAKRYDGDPRIGGIDIGSFGNWGEWHCSGMGKFPFKNTLQTRKMYADMYLKNFKKTDLFFMTDDNEVLEYALGTKKKARVGMRRDGVGSPWHFGRWIGKPPYDKIARMGDVWKDKPIFFELFIDISGMRKNKWDFVYSCDWMLANHIALATEPTVSDGEPKDIAAIDKVSTFAGARLVPQSAEVAYADGKLDVKIVGENKGVSRIYLPFKMKYELRDSAGKVVFDSLSSCDPRKILSGKFEIADSMKVALKGGETYSLSLRVFHTKKVFKDFRFAVNNLNDDGSLNLGKISIK